MIIFSNRVVTKDGVKPAYLKVEGGKIEAIFDASENLTADVNYGNNRIIPGIFDTHNHGAVGYRFDECSEEDVKMALKGEAAFGVTSLFPTLQKLEQFPLFARLMDEEIDGAKMVGIHSEGPWGARVGEKGINLGYPAVDMDIAHKMVEYGGGKLKLVGIAPEVENAFEAIDYFLSQGVTMAAYHTNANFAQANAGFDRGITVATHLMNVMTGLHHRDVGTAGAAILRDEVNCELICDGLHVCLPMVDLVLKMKDHDKIMMVSDNGMYLGAPEGHYRGLGKNTGNDRKTITVTPEGFVLSETGRLSGSSKPVVYGIGNLVEKLGLSIEEAVKMSSLNPAKKYGLTNKGEIAEGKDFDIAVIDDEYNVLATYVEGRKVWDAEKETIPFNPKFIADYKID